jgi:hypothetical protein
MMQRCRVSASHEWDSGTRPTSLLKSILEATGLPGFVCQDCPQGMRSGDVRGFVLSFFNLVSAISWRYAGGMELLDSCLIRSQKWLAVGFVVGFSALFSLDGAMAQTVDSTALGMKEIRERESRGLEAALSYQHLQRSDFGFRDDYMPPDKYGSERFVYLNHNPLELIDYVDDWSEADGKSIEWILTRALEDLRKQGDAASSAVVEAPMSVHSGVNLYYQNHDLNALLTALHPLIFVTLPAAADSALAQLSAKERRFLRSVTPGILLEDENINQRNVFSIDSVQQAERQQTIQLAEIGVKFRSQFLAQEGVTSFVETLRQVWMFVASLERSGVSMNSVLKSDVEIPIRVSPHSYLGKHKGWKISGPGDDNHRGEYSVIIDLGGNDRYDLSYNPKQPHPTIIIDLSGDDIYNGETAYTIGAGMFSVGMLIDLGGADVYRGSNFSIGSGFFGVGILYDAEGDDSYLGDTFTEGAGGFGLGALIDDDGHDMYRAALLSQGVGFSVGAGLLIDKSGNDNYIAGNKYSDYLRYDNHNLSLSQGFGYGLRPYLSGGIGGLMDFSGNDTYVGDIFAQGSSYWRAIGFLFDKSGSDQYLAYQYAQGAGTHMTLGILVDNDGADVYRSKGVSQGCGHDYSFGALYDRRGDDVYYAVDLSQAAGSANGVGLLCDVSGADRYHIGNPKNTHGYGNPRREFGSIGLMLDLGGVDDYDGYGANNSVWRGTGMWGGGLDCQWELWFAPQSAGDSADVGNAGESNAGESSVSEDSND